ncbi:MAG: aspartyl protease family protein [Cyclobacteriaceae bacterium]
MNKKHQPKKSLPLIIGILILLGILFPKNAISQTEIGFIMPEDVDKVEIKFEKFSNLIVLPIRINGSATVKFILDTGAETIILTERLFADMLALNFVREINIHGPGIIDSVKAFVAADVNMTLSGGIEGKSLNVLVLEKDYLELHKNLGEEVYGIIGYELFNRFVVSIDYDMEILTLYRPESYKPRRSYKRVPIEIVDTKPYINQVFDQDGKSDTVRMMVDTGASHAALLDLEATDHLVLPQKLAPTRLGRGLSGEIPGYIGRIENCSIDQFNFSNVLISIPESGAYSKAIKRGSRHGTIGGDILKRFKVVFDYSRESVYLRRGKYFKDQFEYNMSGITLITDGKKLDSLKVIEVTKNTPAHKVGVLKGDKVLKINGLDLENSSISEINALLRKKSGLKIKMTIWRNGQKIKKEFRLDRLI